MIQMKNKNKKQEEIKGENVGINLHGPDPKIGLKPHEHALIGGVQPIQLVSPRRPRYIERERGRGTGDEVDYCHSPLLHPY